MNSLEEFRAFGQYLNEKLLLRFSPIAFRMLWEGDAIPEGTVRPTDGGGKRMAMCQAFARVRRNRKALTMLEDDHWCVWPLACLKLHALDDEDVVTMGTKLFIKDREKSIAFFREQYPWLVCRGRRPIGFSVAPLESSPFVPDAVVIYCRASQLMALVKAAKYYTAELWNTRLDSIVSCAYCTVPVLNGHRFAVTLPDPGEYERALADEDETIFSVRGDELGSLIAALKELDGIRYNYADLNYDMNLEFSRARFYNDLFEKWGLKTGEVFKPGEKTI